MRDRIKSVESILSAVGEETHEGGKKNQYLLVVTTLLFTSFVIAEIIGALAGNSLALLGDASAMSVDIFAYICSWYGERVKIANGGVLDESSRLLVEVYIPTFSLIALLAVSAWVCSDAIVIILNPHQAGDDVSIVYLYAFSCANMVVDLISILLFYMQRHTVFKKKKHPTGNDSHEKNKCISEECLAEARESLLTNDSEDSETLAHTQANAVSMYSPAPDGNDHEEDGHDHAHDHHSGVDINMASALTHVGGDSIRTAAVFICAVITTCGVNGTLCDAWATIAVTFSILAMVFPLMNEIYHALFKKPSLLDTKKTTSTAYDKLYKEGIVTVSQDGSI